jgi:hypothetical protein
LAEQIEFGCPGCPGGTTWHFPTVVLHEKILAGALHLVAHWSFVIVPTSPSLV